jgi:Type IV leader peptidase family.
MYAIEQIGGIIFLLVCACYDVKMQRIPVWLLVFGGIGAAIIRVILQENWWVYIAGILLGSTFLLVSKMTKEALGYGDSVLILILGAFVGLRNMLLVLVIAFASAAVFSIFVLAFKKMSRKKRFPFVPFLLGGFIGGCLL